jgi:hypothetical protein
MRKNKAVVKEEMPIKKVGALYNEQKDNDNCNEIKYGFLDKGIPEKEIKPKENIFTYLGWKKRERQVMKGEKGVKLEGLIPMFNKDGSPILKKNGRQQMKKWTKSFFHFSQTEAIKKVA